MKRSKDDHPTIADRSPLDCCGWCYEWITTGHVVLSVTGYPQPKDRAFAELVIDGRPVLGTVPPPESEVAADTDVVVVLCSDRCAEALERALDADKRWALGEVVLAREPSPAERLAGEELVGGVCAWCYTSVGPDDPGIVIVATLTGPGRGVPGMITIQIDGRPVPGTVPQAGSPAAVIGTDIGFRLCGRPCADALTAAIERDRARGIVH